MLTIKLTSKKSIFWMVFLFVASSSLSALPLHPQPEELELIWEVLDNTYTFENSQGVVKEDVYLAQLTIKNNSIVDLGSDWKLYYTSVRPPATVSPAKGELLTYANLQMATQGLLLTRADDAASGDYFLLQPLNTFVSIPAGQSREILILVNYWQLMKSDSPGAFHIVFDDLPRIVSAVMVKVEFDATDPKQTTGLSMGPAGDKRPVQTAAIRFEENTALLQPLLIKNRIVPQPYSVVESSGELHFPYDGAIIYSTDLSQEAELLKSYLSNVLTGNYIQLLPNGSYQHPGKIILTIQNGLDVDGDSISDPEGYIIEVNPWTGIHITGADNAGVLYGIQSLRQLISPILYKQAADISQKPAAVTFPSCVIKDAPRFRYRGFLLDVSRNFQDKGTVYKVLDMMAFFKLNKFQLTVANDEGWRLEIPGLPELTEYGAKRGFDPAEEEMLHLHLGTGDGLADGDGIQGKPGTELAANLGVELSFQGFEQGTLNYIGKGWGYYSVQDFKDILAYAAARNIDIILEFDFPAHARAAIMSMEYRYEKYKKLGNMQKAEEYRLIDPDDTSHHETAQYFHDNFVNPGLESTFTFLAKIVSEVTDMYNAVPEAKMTAFHGGGDELPHLSVNQWWQGSPIIQNHPSLGVMTENQRFEYFLNRFSSIISNIAGTPMYGWADAMYKNGTGNTKIQNFVPVFWNCVWGWGDEDSAYQFANDYWNSDNDNYEIILAHAPSLYLDLAYNKDPDEPGYHWAGWVDTKRTFTYRPFNIRPNAYQKWDHTWIVDDVLNRPISTSTDQPHPTEWDSLTRHGEANILGIQGQLFAENQKHPELLEYFMFPKLLGVAERAWNRNMPVEADMDTAWNQFCNTLGQWTLPILDYYMVVAPDTQTSDILGINYRIPLPGGKIVSGQLYANIVFPGLIIEYSLDDGLTWSEYIGPVYTQAQVLLRCVTSDGRNSRISTVLP